MPAPTMNKIPPQPIPAGAATVGPYEDARRFPSRPWAVTISNRDRKVQRLSGVRVERFATESEALDFLEAR